MSVAGPLNNIWGPGLAFEAFTDQVVPVGSNDRFFVFFYAGATTDPTAICAEASAFVRGDGSSTLVVGQTTTQDIGSFRAGQSAGGEVALVIHRYNLLNQDQEPPVTIPAVSWDPSLHLDTLLKSSSSGGGLTPEQDATLTAILNAVSQVYRNRS